MSRSLATRSAPPQAGGAMCLIDDRTMQGHRVLTLGPTRQISVNRARLQALRVESARDSVVDRSIVELVAGALADTAIADTRPRSSTLRSSAGPARTPAQARLTSARTSVLVLRGTLADGRPGWCFSADLSRDEEEELGYRLMRSQLRVYREMLSLGVLAHLRVEWGAREIGGLELGTRRLCAELEQARQRGARARAEADLDLWILQYQSKWLLMPYEQCMNMFLPRIVRLLDAREAQVERLQLALNRRSA